MRDVTVFQVNEILGKGSVLLDVREGFEVAEGVIGGALHIPLGELAEKVDQLRKDEDIIVICRSGNRSGTATDFLLENGFRARNMAGGMVAWEEAGFSSVLP